MTVAFVLISTKAGNEGDILDKLLDMHEVREAYKIYGEYDLIAKIEMRTLRDLERFIKEKLKRIYGVQYISTLIIIP